MGLRPVTPPSFELVLHPLRCCFLLLFYILLDAGDSINKIIILEIRINKELRTFTFYSVCFCFRNVFFLNMPTTQLWKWNTTAISELLTVWFAVSAGILLSMALNAANLSPLLVLCTYTTTIAALISTSTAPVKLEDIARESPREPFEWDSTLEIAEGRNLVLMLPPAIIQSPVS